MSDFAVLHFCSSVVNKWNQMELDLLAGFISVNALCLDVTASDAGSVATSQISLIWNYS